MLSPIAWRTPPRDYGPWERITSLLTEELIKEGLEVTLFATKESQTKGKLEAVCPKGYEEDKRINPKVWECLHLANCFEKASHFDIIHNQFDFLPLSYSKLISTPLMTTIHGFSSPGILPVYKKYNNHVYYVSISNADRVRELDYIATVYHGIDIKKFSYIENPSSDYLLFYGRFHHDKGAKEAIQIAKQANKKLIMAGIIQDENYFNKHIKPNLDNNIQYIGTIGPEKRNKILGNALALLHPINFAEPFGLSVIEAMACGTPVIAFNKGSMPELLTDKTNGFLVNTIKEAVSAVSKLHTLDRTQCRKNVVDNFTSKKMAKEYIKIYQKILKQKKGKKNE